MTDASAAPEPGPAPPGGTPPGPAPAGLGLTIGAIAVGALAVVLVVATVLVGLVWQGAQDKQDRRAAVQAAARQETVNLLNVDYKTAKQSSDRVLSGATGAFKDQWGGTVAQQFVDTLAKEQSVQTVQAVHVGIVNLNANTAETIVSVSSVVTTSQVPAGAQRNYRISMDLQRSGSRWLVSKFGLIP